MTSGFEMCVGPSTRVARVGRRRGTQAGCVRRGRVSNPSSHSLARATYLAFSAAVRVTHTSSFCSDILSILHLASLRMNASICSELSCCDRTTIPTAALIEDADETRPSVVTSLAAGPIAEDGMVVGVGVVLLPSNAYTLQLPASQDDVN